VEPPKKRRVFLFGALAGTAAVLVCSAAVVVITSRNKVQSPETAPPIAGPTAQAASSLPAAAPTLAPAVTPAPPPPAPKPVEVAEAPPQVTMPVPVTPKPAPTATTEPAPDLRAAVAAAVKPAAASDDIHSWDEPKLLDAAKENRKIAIIGTVDAVRVDSAEKRAHIVFKDNSDLRVTYYQRLYSAMSKKFSGHDGNGLGGKTVRVSGYAALVDGKPEITVNSTNQVEVVTP
jgi:hypothetical protein